MTLILKSDRLSTVLISVLIGQCNRTVHVMSRLSTWTVHAITCTDFNGFYMSLLAKKKLLEFLVF